MSAPSLPMLLTADWVLPIAAPPIREGFVAVEGERIAAVGSRESLPRPADLHLPGMALLPGLVNLHTHLDYSLLADLPEDLGFSGWIQALTRRAGTWTDEQWLASARHGVQQLLRSGVTCVVDSGYSGASLRALTEAGLRGIAGSELFGRIPGQEAEQLAELQERVRAWRAAASPRVQVGIAIHSPYTVIPTLWSLATAWATEQRLPIQCHLAESPAEAELVARGTGELRDFLAALGQDSLPWEPRGHSPTAHVAAAGGLVPGLLAAHCVQVDDADLRLLRTSGAAIAPCPRSNARLGCGRAPLERIVAAGLPWGLGTDSAASGGSLNLWEEMRFAREAHGGAEGRKDGRTEGQVEREALLRQVTLGAAQALGWESRIGSLEAGKVADLIAVPVGRFTPGRGDLYTHLVDTVEGAALVMVAGELLQHP